MPAYADTIEHSLSLARGCPTRAVWRALGPAYGGTSNRQRSSETNSYGVFSSFAVRCKAGKSRGDRLPLGKGPPVTHVRPSAVIRVIRPWRFAHGVISYRVFVDENECGKLNSGKSVEVPVGPGDHMVEVVGRSARSGSLQVAALPGEVCNVECLTRLSLFPRARNSWSLGMGKAPAAIALHLLS
jgi:hypothetical protein